MATCNELAAVRAQIEQRTADMIERTIVEAQAFTASPAYAKAIREIVAKGQSIEKRFT